MEPDLTEARDENAILTECNKKLARPSAFHMEWVNIRPGLMLRIRRNFATKSNSAEERLMIQSVGISVELYSTAEQEPGADGTQQRVLVSMETEDMLGAVAASTKLVKDGLAATWDERRRRWILS